MLPDPILEDGYLTSATSAQQAELYALTRACLIHKGKNVNIYTDSRYTFGVAHDYCMI